MAEDILQLDCEFHAQERLRRLFVSASGRLPNVDTVAFSRQQLPALEVRHSHQAAFFEHYFFQILLFSFLYQILGGGEWEVDSEGREDVVEYPGSRAKFRLTRASTATTSRQPSSKHFGISFRQLSTLLSVAK